jgi:hypothetical protein
MAEDSRPANEPRRSLRPRCRRLVGLGLVLGFPPEQSAALPAVGSRATRLAEADPGMWRLTLRRRRLAACWSCSTTGVSAQASKGGGGPGRGARLQLALGVEAGQKGPDAELELVLGGDAGQQRGQLDGIGNSPGGRAAKKAHMRRTGGSGLPRLELADDAQVGIVRACVERWGREVRPCVEEIGNPLRRGGRSAFPCPSSW